MLPTVVTIFCSERYDMIWTILPFVFSVVECHFLVIVAESLWKIEVAL